jgi:hypothetical protein
MGTLGRDSGGINNGRRNFANCYFFDGNGAGNNRNLFLVPYFPFGIILFTIVHCCHNNFGVSLDDLGFGL